MRRHRDISNSSPTTFIISAPECYPPFLVFGTSSSSFRCQMKYSLVDTQVLTLSVTNGDWCTGCVFHSSSRLFTIRTPQRLLVSSSPKISSYLRRISHGELQNPKNGRGICIVPELQCQSTTTYGSGDDNSSTTVPDGVSASLISFVHEGLTSRAQELWDQIINSCYVPDLGVVSSLMDAYGRIGRFDEVLRILRDVTSRDFGFNREVYSSAIICFGGAGQLELMELAFKEMISKGFKVDSLIGNSYIKYHSMFGTLAEMGIAYNRMKKSRVLIEKEGIRAVTSAYIRERKYYQLGEFLRDVGLGRRNTGTLLWNLLLLSYAVNFKMKTLQREFLRMVEAGFSPDLNTFNIRALAFSRMRMFWDLHLTIEHMNRLGIIPDIVTYGCIVDAYVERKLARNLSFALTSFNVDATPLVLTDPLVFEAFGKGDFHLFSEVLLESKRQTIWTYSKLVNIYRKRTYRSNQIFWNY